MRKEIIFTLIVLCLLLTGVAQDDSDSVPAKPIQLTVSAVYEGSNTIGHLKWRDVSDNELGFEIDEAHYLDPLMLLTKQVVVGTPVAAYGSDAFLEQLAALGYKLDFETPKVVLIGIKQHFESDEYAQMIEYILQGASLVGMHETTLYAKDEKRYPGVGAILKMLSFATSAPYEVVGKPSQLFYESALEKLQMQEKEASFDKITIISDDVKGDLVGAKKLGMKTVFVLSGKYKNASEIIPMLTASQRPEWVCADMKEVGEKI